MSSESWPPIGEEKGIGRPLTRKKRSARRRRRSIDMAAIEERERNGGVVRDRQRKDNVGDIGIKKLKIKF